LPRRVRARDSGWKRSLARRWMSGTVTRSISVVISSREKKRPQYICWRANEDMREPEVSRPRTMLPLIWDLARLELFVR